MDPPTDDNTMGSDAIQPNNLTRWIIQLPPIILGVLFGNLAHVATLLRRTNIDTFQTTLGNVNNFSSIELILPRKKNTKILYISVLVLMFVLTFSSSSDPLKSIVTILVAGMLMYMMRQWDCINYTKTLHTEDTILAENHADAGYVLAQNYFDGFLRHVLRDANGENLGHVVDQFAAVLETHLERASWRGGLEELGIEVYSKLIILLPQSCHINLKKESILRRERVYTLSEFEPQLDVKKLDLSFCRRPVDNDSMRLPIFWIYRSEEDETQHNDPEKKLSAKKLLFTLDFPTILKSATQNKDVWTHQCRNRLISTFCDWISQCMECRDFDNAKDNVVFCKFSDSRADWDAVDKDIGRPPLSHTIRRIILHQGI